MSRKKKADAHEGNGVHTNGTALAELPTDKPPDTPAPEPITGPPVEHPPPDQSDHAAPNRPARSFSYPVAAGVSIQASCWPKEIQYDGRIITVYSVQVRKSYWHEEEKCWKNTTYFRSSELSIARHAMQRAEEWCLDQRQSDVPF